MKITGHRYEIAAYHINSGGVDVAKQRKMQDDKDKPSACVTVTVSDEAKRLYKMAVQCATDRENE